MERHSAAADQEHSIIGAVVIGAVVTGTVAIGAVAIGMAVIGMAVIGAGANSSFPVDLVFRSSTGIPITGTIRTVTNTATTAIQGTVTTAIQGMATTAIQGTATTAIHGTATAIRGTGITATKETATATTKATATAAIKDTTTAITGHKKSDRYRRDAANEWRLVQKLVLFKRARVHVCLDHVAGIIINPNRSTM